MGAMTDEATKHSLHESLASSGKPGTRAGFMQGKRPYISFGILASELEIVTSRSTKSNIIDRSPSKNETGPDFKVQCRPGLDQSSRALFGISGELYPDATCVLVRSKTDATKLNDVAVASGVQLTTASFFSTDVSERENPAQESRAAKTC
jgi:hypothetical protein